MLSPIIILNFQILHSKLNGNIEAEQPTNRIKSALLYDGSILTCDSRLCGYDIATCLEVIGFSSSDCYIAFRIFTSKKRYITQGHFNFHEVFL